jgi:hypothetical protein
MYNPEPVFGADDTMVNGDILVGQTSNVIYDNTANYIVHIPRDFNTANDPGNFEPLPTTKAQLTAFMCLNLHALRAAVADEAHRVALCYYRFLAVKYRLMSYHYGSEAYHVDYNQCVRTNVNEITIANLNTDDDQGLSAANKRAAHALLTAHLTLNNFRLWNKNFINIVCTLAYMFRSRGHHYFGEMQPKYESLWRKYATRDNNIGCTWEHVTTIGLHAIMPLILDNFWTHCRDTAKCDGALSIRHSCFGAGTSVFNVVNRGVTDLLLVLPHIEERVAEPLNLLRQAVAQCERNRWAHTINARFYGADPTRLDEGPIGVIAALIKACVEGLVPDAPLLESKSLKRAAAHAPISGAAYGRAITNYVKGDRFLAIPNSASNG